MNSWTCRCTLCLSSSFCLVSFGGFGGGCGMISHHPWWLMWLCTTQGMKPWSSLPPPRQVLQFPAPAPFPHLPTLAAITAFNSSNQAGIFHLFHSHPSLLSVPKTRETPADGANWSFCTNSGDKQRCVLEGWPSCLILNYAEHSQHFEWGKLCQGTVWSVCRSEVKPRGTQLPLSIPMKSNPIHFFNNSILNQILTGLIEGCQELSFQGWGLGIFPVLTFFPF